MKSTKNNVKIEKVESKQSINKSKSLWRLLKLAVPYSKMILVAIVCVLLVNGAQLLKPYILKIVIDDFLVGRNVQSGLYSITSLGILYFVVVALGGVFAIAQANIINKVGQGIMRGIRSRVFKIIQYLPLAYLDKMSSGRLITRATNDVEALSEMYTNVLISLFKDVFLLIGIVYAMLALNVKLALISFCVVPLMFLIIFILKKKIKDNFKNMKNLIGRINGFMAENISGMKIIQIFNGENVKNKEFKELNKKYFKTTSFQVWLNSILRPSADVFQSLAVALLIWYAMGAISNNTLEIGVLYAFTTYIKQFFNPIADLADNYTTIQSALVSSDRIFELIDQEEILEDLDSGIHLDNIHGHIEFKNVWFSYNDKDWVLKDVSFQVNKGETVAFVGETGAGKTTIISLISGFYKVQKGEILIDGINIDDVRLRDLRKNMAVVLQDVFLFSGNIENNITLNDKIDSEVVEEAVKDSCADELVNSMPQGLSEPVMERGSTFSAGEKQLFSFARALAHSPTILVLDEATSNIDTKTELLIQKAIENASKDRTTLVIAHRLSTIRNADNIIVLKHGEIVETGNHSKLMDLGGYYKNLVVESKSFNGYIEL
ncbi:MAG: ABC transporter ATP-binding protein [Clostridium sp.]|uniref:ABC transporter ATP-binding protein n=1 Tax=Clostridium sp. TaxID=1506 RepID=UPI00306E3C0E